MTRDPDVLVVGAGPSGLATAISCARRGRSVVVLDRRESAPIDKACGEGLMPDAVQQLHDWGIHPEGRPLRGIRYRDEHTTVDGSFPGRAGLGVRRTELSRALLEGVRREGAQLHLGDAFEELSREGARWTLRSRSGRWRPRVLVAADGLRSPLRRASGLDRPHRGRRVGMRRHVQIPLAEQGDQVEVIWGDGVEAYLTPVGEQELGVALLEDPRRRGRGGSGSGRASDAGAPLSAFDRAARRVPGLVERLDGLEPVDGVAGSGPLRATAASPVRGNLALVGDAGGYVDAITGEGMAIAFAEAEALGVSLERAWTEAPVRQPKDACLEASLRAFARSSRRVRRLPDLVTHGALLLAARPGLRRRFLRVLARRPSRFDRILALHVRAGSDWGALPVAAALGWGLVTGG